MESGLASRDAPSFAGSLLSFEPDSGLRLQYDRGYGIDIYQAVQWHTFFWTMYVTYNGIYFFLLNSLVGLVWPAAITTFHPPFQTRHRFLQVGCVLAAKGPF